MSSNTSTESLTNFSRAELSNSLAILQCVDAPTNSKKRVSALFLGLLEKLTPPPYSP